MLYFYQILAKHIIFNQIHFFHLQNIITVYTLELTSVMKVSQNINSEVNTVLHYKSKTKTYTVGNDKKRL